MDVTAAAREPEANNELPPCYGLYWEAIGDSPCTRCEVRRRCLHSFVTGELVAVLGPAKHVSLSARGVTIAGHPGESVEGFLEVVLGNDRRGYPSGSFCTVQIADVC
jgi:hypothetical protein